MKYMGTPRKTDRQTQNHIDIDIYCTFYFKALAGKEKQRGTYNFCECGLKNCYLIKYILVNKLKTILKHILDVSERYAANDLFNELCHAVKAEQICQVQGTEN